MLVAGAVSAQIIEAVVEVDSVPRSLWCNEENGKVYCGTSKGMCVIDGTTNRVTARIENTAWVDPIMYFEPGNKVYFGNGVPDELVVLDGESDSVLTRIPIDADALCCNPVLGKVYCCGYGGGIAVLDAWSDTIIRTLPTTSRTASLLYSPISSKVYYAGQVPGEIAVIDSRADTVLAVDTVGMWNEQLCLNSTTNRVYCTHWTWYDTAVSAFDGVTNEIVAHYRDPHQRWWDGLCFNPLRDKMYAARSSSDGQVVVFDGNSDTAMAVIPVGFYPSNLLYNPTTDRVFCANTGGDGLEYDSTVTVIDGETDTVLATFVTGPAPCAMALNPNLNRVHIANRRDSTVVVVRDVIGIEEENGAGRANTRPPTILCSSALLPGGRPHSRHPGAGCDREAGEAEPGRVFPAVGGQR